MSKTRSWVTYLTAMVIVAFCGAILAGCGGNSPGRSSAIASLCTPANTDMQCSATGNTAPSSNPLLGAAFGSKFGYDFAWGGPSGAEAQSGGAYFAFSYLSGTSKDWTYSLLHDYTAHGRSVGFVWETSATRALQGYAAGKQDALNAAAEEARLGYAGSFTYFADDFDSTNYSCASLCPYYQGADAAIGVNRVGDYGGLHTVEVLSAAHVVSGSWQTLAWSGGVWSSAACLRQVGINDFFAGHSVDNDYAVCPNYGQFGYVVAPPKPVGPTPAQITGYEKARNASLVAYHNHYCNQPALTFSTCVKFASRVVYYQEKTGLHVQCWGPHAKVAAPVCQIVRPRVSVRSHARNATEKAYGAHDCQGPANFGDGVHTPLCNELRSRDAYFTRLVAADLKRW